MKTTPEGPECLGSPVASDVWVRFRFPFHEWKGGRMKCNYCNSDVNEECYSYLSVFDNYCSNV